MPQKFPQFVHYGSSECVPADTCSQSELTCNETQSAVSIFIIGYELKLLVIIRQILGPLIEDIFYQIQAVEADRESLKLHIKSDFGMSTERDFQTIIDISILIG